MATSPSWRTACPSGPRPTSSPRSTNRVPEKPASGLEAEAGGPITRQGSGHRTELIGRIHLDSRGTHGARRVHAELTLGQGLEVGRCAVEMLMHRAGLVGLSGRPRFRRIPHVATAGDLVERQFRREEPDRLWVTDIVRHEALSTAR